MGFISKLFGTTAASPEEEARREEERRFNTLRDDGVRAMKMGEVKYAVQCLEKALELRPDDLPATGYLAEALVLSQNFADALPRLERLAAACPDNVEVRLLLAQAQGKTADFAGMRETAAALLADCPGEPRAIYLAAEAAKGLGDDFGAIAFLTQALALREDYAEARRLRAAVLADMGQWHEVAKDTAALVEAQPDNDEVLVMHGNALAACGDNEAAEAAYRRALEANPFGGEAVVRLGQLYETTSRPDLALKTYDEAIALRPDFAEAYKLRGGVKHRLHDEAGAAEDLKKALEIKPALAETLDGEFSNIENRQNETYRSLNPYGF